MSRSRRLFFALWPDEATRLGLVHWQTHNLPAGVRWTHRADLHLTLHFLGQVDSGRLDALHALGAGVSATSFAMVLDDIGYWPRPQVLWVGPTSMPGELTQLHARLGEGLRALGLPTEERSFQPHMTLARKVRHRPELGPLQPLTWPVTELTLVESCAGMAPMYQPIGRWPLA